MMLPNISQFIKNYVTKRKYSFFQNDLINNKEKLTKEIKGKSILESLRKVLVSSVKPFSLVSTTINSEGLYLSAALIYEDPMVPAPPITRIDFPLISLVNFSLLFIRSFSKKLFSLFVT